VQNEAGHRQAIKRLNILKNLTQHKHMRRSEATHARAKIVVSYITEIKSGYVITNFQLVLE